ncbi:phage tail protein [Desulfogranum marinum]|uniref:phage tail protein n=1 Tax=Desulfogranum marinum TaxID=453220 RepID=UPI0029C913F1|nr:phage tail protein [Desulfogranum marinum]
MSRDFVMVHSADQWLRTAFKDTSMGVERDAVQLAWELEENDDVGVTPPSSAGLAFDPWCRLYRSIPEQGCVTRALWGDSGPEGTMETNLFATVSPQRGDFILEKNGSQAFNEPQGLAIDSLGRLFIAESASGRIFIYDLLEKRLLRMVHLGRAVRDLACHGHTVFALLDGPPTLAILDARSGPRLQNITATLLQPSRLAVSFQGCIWVLDCGGEEDATVVPLDLSYEAFSVPHATDLEFSDEDVVVVARTPGQDFRRFRVLPEKQFELPHMRARHYDGRGIVRIPNGGIGFWTANGFGRATLARMRYVKEGRVISFRLDSGRFQTVWGRMFLDACIPKGTKVTIRCLTLDEVPDEAKPVRRTPPANTTSMTIHRPDLSPPMPPKDFLDAASKSHILHRRGMGSEIPWKGNDRATGYATYEAPVIADAGRYLWVVLELKGTTRLTPRLKSLRVEYPAHDLLRRLPRLYSRDKTTADFLGRYLSIMEGSMREIDLRAIYRHILLDPDATPQEVLPWLAGFIGMTLDERWPLNARRTLIRNGVWLFRYRGTVTGLKRFIEIYLCRSIEIVEHFKVSGLGGAIVGEADALASRAVLGAGFRVGGNVGHTEAVSVNEETIEDAFESHAHRFSIVIPISLDQEKKEVIKHILDLHRPCHTMYDICSVDAGMKAGIGLYIGLTSMVGRTSGFGTVQTGGSLLGRHDIIGRPVAGTRPGSSRLGEDSRVG